MEKVSKMLIHPPAPAAHPYPPPAPQGRQVASHVVVLVVVVVQSTMVQSLVQQRAVHHMHHAPLFWPKALQQQLARVGHIPSHGTMTPPNTLILPSTLRKKLIKISRASNFAPPPSPFVHECDFFLSALFVPPSSSSCYFGLAYFITRK